MSSNTESLLNIGLDQKELLKELALLGRAVFSMCYVDMSITGLILFQESSKALELPMNFISPPKNLLG